MNAALLLADDEPFLARHLPEDGFRLVPAHGAYDLALPDGSDCRVALRTLKGHVACAVPLQDEARAEGTVTGKIGEGKGTLDASAVTGNITIEMHVSF